jgi:aminoglycoside 6'-N-acetyltransferase
MPPKSGPETRYSFRAVTEDDLPMIAGWLADPHAAEWWEEGPEAGIAEIREAMDSISTEPLIVELDGRPIGYLQSYDPHLEDDHPYRDQPFGTLGIDVTIGIPELVGKGHGSRFIAQFIDPDPSNLRAIRAYEKAGFKTFDTRHSVYGPALMMAKDADP